MGPNSVQGKAGNRPPERRLLASAIRPETLRRTLDRPPRWYQWEGDVMDLLDLLAEKDDPGVKPVEVSLAQLRKLMAAGSEGASLRFTSEGTVREP